MAAIVSKAALALEQKKNVQEQIHNIWETCLGITYDEARHVPPTEVTVALSEATWEPEYSIPGKNTHVSIIIFIKIYFQIPQKIFILTIYIDNIYPLLFTDESYHPALH